MLKIYLYRLTTQDPKISRPLITEEITDTTQLLMTYLDVRIQIRAQIFEK